MGTITKISNCLNITINDLLSGRFNTKPITLETSSNCNIDQIGKMQCSVRLKEALKLRNLKQEDLSRLTGISTGTLSQYITGLYEHKQDKLCKLSKALNISEAWLMGFDINTPTVQNYTEYLNNLSLNELEQIIVETYLSFSDEDKNTIKKCLTQIILNCYDK